MRFTPDEALELVERDYPDGKPSSDHVDSMMSSFIRNGMGITWFSSSGYPSVLAGIPDPPAILFFRGDLAGFAGKPTVAVIGSRRSSIYGRRTARALSRDLALAGVVVTSGLARGIDAEAHMGALDGGGPTVAVLGSGVDIIYPPEHEKLAERICRNGVLVSEYPPLTSPDRFNFPARNRIISGLSMGVVVVEAGEKSGTMITVNSALDQGREVFAVPGEVTRTTSRGTNRLLKEGAGLVTSVDDILETLGIEPSGSSHPLIPEVEGEIAEVIVRILSTGAKQIDELVRALGADPGILQAELLMLEMQGLVVRRPGEIYTLS